MMTPAQHDLVIAMCARAAECWCEGELDRAERWAAGARDAIGNQTFVDVDEEADR